MLNMANHARISCLILVYDTFLTWTCLGAVCHESYECFLSNISETSDPTLCIGDNSCRQAVQIQSTSGGNIDCDGAFSCYKSLSVQTISSSTDDPINCRGLYSCAKIDNLYVNNGHLDCVGELSCFGSIINYKWCS